MESERYSVGSKVATIFRELVGARAERLDGSRAALETMARLKEGLQPKCPDEVAADVAFHLADWNSDAAFLVAVHLFPERFTDEEIATGITAFLIHAPNHVAAAAKLAGYPIQDVFGVGPQGEDGR
jgi:hypothetical protein